MLKAKYVWHREIPVPAIHTTRLFLKGSSPYLSAFAWSNR
jgi:hypothetical protein